MNLIINISLTKHVLVVESSDDLLVHNCCRVMSCPCRMVSSRVCLVVSCCVGVGVGVVWCGMTSL